MIGRTDVVANNLSTTISCTALCTGRALPGNEALRLQTAGGRCPGNLSKIGITEFFDVFMNVVEVVEMLKSPHKRCYAADLNVLAKEEPVSRDIVQDFSSGTFCESQPVSVVIKRLSRSYFKRIPVIECHVKPYILPARQEAQFIVDDTCPGG